MKEEVVLPFISLGIALSKNAKANFELSILNTNEGLLGMKVEG